MMQFTVIGENLIVMPTHRQDIYQRGTWEDRVDLLPKWRVCCHLIDSLLSFKISHILLLDMDIDEILLDPANRLIIQAILKYQIQTLLKKLSETGVETLVLTASTEDKDLGYLGSEKGNDFLNHVSLEVVRKQFLHFCANTEPDTNSSTSLAADASLPGKNFHLESYNRCIQQHKKIRNAIIHVEKISSQPCADNCDENAIEQNRSNNAESQRRMSPSRVNDRSDQKVIDECSKNSQAMKSERQDRVSNPVGTEEDIYIRANLYVGCRQKDSNVLTSSNINDSDLEMLCETVCRNISQETEHDKLVYKPDEIYDSSVNKKRELCHSDLNFPTSQRNNYVCTEKNDSSYTVSAALNDSKLANEIQIIEEEARIKSEPHDLDPDPNLSDLMYPNAESATQSLNCDFTMNENNECIVSMSSLSTVSEGRMSSTSCTGVNSINTLNNCGNNCYNQQSITTSSALVSDILCASEFPLNSRGDSTNKVHHTINYRKMSNDLACSECGQMFNKTPSLIRHKVRKHSPQIFECHVCAKKYGYKSDLDKHFRTHSGEKPYACSVCGRGFADSGNKNKHECKCRLHIRRLSMSERDNFS